MSEPTRTVVISSAGLAGSPSNGMSEDHMLALFLLSGIRVDGWSEMPNQYWPEVPEYAHLRKHSPWWRVNTGAGPITIGWRKRVIAIDWSDTLIRAIVTKDDTTKDQKSVHAWSYGDAVEYLTELKHAARREALR